jgi:hypothetical protein
MSKSQTHTGADADRLQALSEAEASLAIEGLSLNADDRAVIVRAIEEGLGSDEAASRVLAHLVAAGVIGEDARVHAAE